MSGRVHYGSLEEADRKRKLPDHEPESNGAEVAKTSRPFSGGVELSDIHRKAVQSALESIEQQLKRPRLIVVPRDDEVVRARLRDLKEPVTLFAEQPADRRDRLKKILEARDDVDVPGTSTSGTTASSDTSPPATASLNLASLQEEFYTRGSEHLKAARKFILRDSFTRAKERLHREEELKATPVHSLKAQRQELYNNLKVYSLTASQLGGDRPLSYCSFSPTDETIATASWSGHYRIWNVPDLTLRHEFTDVGDRPSCIEYHPRSGLEADLRVHLASSDATGKISLWSLSDTKPVTTFTSHALRTSRVAFHPSGKYLGSASFDTTWRLWDLERSCELLLQEGHSKEVYCLNFHPDGALVVTGGFDGNVISWDLRSGKMAHVFRGHSASVLGVDCSPNGYEVASCGEDNTAQIWDLRNAALSHTLFPHSNVVTRVKYHPSAAWLLTTSHDQTARVWGVYDWKPLAVLAGDAGKVMCGDMSKQSNLIVTSNFDRTFKLWSPSALSSS